jgi:hypothetical protein
MKTADEMQITLLAWIGKLKRVEGSHGMTEASKMLQHVRACALALAWEPDSLADVFTGEDLGERACLCGSTRDFVLTHKGAWPSCPDCGMV